MGEHKHEAFLAGSNGSWLLMPRCKGICRWGGWLRESFPMHNSRKTHDASSRATQSVFMEVSWVGFTASTHWCGAVSSRELCQSWQVARGGFPAGSCGCTLQPWETGEDVEGDTCLGHCRSWEDLIHGPDSECNLPFVLVLLRHYTCGTVVLFS